MKKVKSYFLITTLLIFSATIQLGFFLCLNNARTATAEKLYKKGNETGENQLLYLTQSNILAPNEEKKLLMIDLYLAAGETEKAQRLLKNTKNEAGYIKYAEFSLENNYPEHANKQISFIKNEEAKRELEIFRDFKSGAFETITELGVEPKTNVGKLLKSLNTLDFSNLGESTLSQKIKDLALENTNQPTKTLKVAREMNRSNQPEIALFLLHNLSKENANIEAYLLESEIYEKKGNMGKALESNHLAIQLEPENKTLYEKGITLAKKQNDEGKLTAYQQTLNRLNKLQK